MDSMIAIKLVKKSTFRERVFKTIEKRAKKVIDSAQANQILALTITSPPLRVADARIFNRDVFESILSDEDKITYCGW